MLTLAASGDGSGRARSIRLIREDDITFLRRRAKEEAERAATATGPDAAKAHLRLAAAYRARVVKAESVE